MMIRALTVLAACTALVACAPKQKAQVAAPAGNWISLFNGKNLDDWTVKIAGQDVGDNYRNTFRVEDGLLQVSYQQYDKFADRFGSLFYNKPLSRYWIRAEYRFVGKAAPGAPAWTYKNSGIQLHSQSPQSMRKEQQFPVSVEFDIVGGWFVGRRPTGDVCHYGTRILLGGAPLKVLCSKVGDVTIRDDRWVTVLAEVDGGKRVRQIVNGALVVEYTDLTLDDGNADAQRLMAAGAGKALTAGYLSLQSNGYPIEFRRIEVLPLDVGAGQDSRH
jgi:hypothetical protein